MKRAALVGAGLIGRAWALVFARAGWQVSLYDVSPTLLERLPAQLSAEAQILTRHGLTAADSDLLGAVDITNDLEHALSQADFVQENGPERLEVKQQIFADLDRLAASDLPLVSSTSAIVTSQFAASVRGRGRCLVGHPVNPPHLVPLVEVSGAPFTDQAVLEHVYQTYCEIGQVPVRIHKETDGFVLNRLQGALLAEAMRLAGEGVISVTDLDRTVKDGLGRRWAFMGPFETIELNAPAGAEDYFQRYGPLFYDMASSPAGSAVFSPEQIARVVASWPERLAAADIHSKTAWRNERLAALAAHNSAQPKPDRDNEGA